MLRGCADGSTIVWNLNDKGNSHNKLDDGHYAAINDLCFSPNRRWLASIDRDGQLIIRLAEVFLFLPKTFQLPVAADRVAIINRIGEKCTRQRRRPVIAKELFRGVVPVTNWLSSMLVIRQYTIIHFRDDPTAILIGEGKVSSAPETIFHYSSILSGKKFFGVFRYFRSRRLRTISAKQQQQKKKKKKLESGKKKKTFSYRWMMDAIIPVTKVG